MKILITGGTGSLGQALVERWRNTHDLTILSRNPHKQQTVMEQYRLNPSNFVLSDLDDIEALTRACDGQDVLIHAAALKVVSQGEQNPEEYLRVNGIGSKNLARVWYYTGQNRPALYINSDKAVAPVNFYGVTKRIGEVSFLSRGFSSIRYGNVVKSEGSFVHKWAAAVTAGWPIKVRIPNPTRFYLSFDQALTLIDSALSEMKRGWSGVFVPHGLEAFSLEEVARAYTDQVNICYEMLQAGEKQHEVLLQEGEKARGVNGLLSVVEEGRYDELPPEYSSATAPRISGAEFLDRMKISPPQRIFA